MPVYMYIYSEIDPTDVLEKIENDLIWFWFDSIPSNNSLTYSRAWGDNGI